ncbi:MAG: hypothetical protein NVSMB56_18430 [Pyrinomonadaceae bacterium]
MLPTYKAILRGNRLEWRDEQPANLGDEQAVEALVTILHADKTDSNGSHGKQMRAALEKLAALTSLPDITDPIAWQREQREERTLPERDV